MGLNPNRFAGYVDQLASLGLISNVSRTQGSFSFDVEMPPHLKKED